ncbi:MULTISPECIES: helix-turn-helix transcriptional regulator [unclassified Ensifer]|uniref:helix-turn-helix transcriptional regulator n=1 Tax=unclassified Ensifer TaxID=2633371 RepID=UPI00300F925E
MSLTHQPYWFRSVNLATLSKCQRLIERTAATVPFEHILITGLDVEGMELGTGTLLASSFPAEYLHTYFSEGHLSADPLVALTLSAKRIVTDEEAWREQKFDEKSRRLHELMLRYDIGHRTVVPVARSERAYGSIIVTSRRPLTDGEQEYLQFLAEPLHNATAEPFADEVRTRLRLTVGEMRCIALASQGLTSDEIAERSAYSTETVNTYLKSATRKLGASNRTQAVAEALRRRLIS